MTKQHQIIPASDFAAAEKSGRFESLFPDDAVCWRIMKRWEQVVVVEWWSE